MIISPPFIPDPVAGQSDSAFLDATMVCGEPGTGGFPISFELNWHGGVHLTAPGGDTPLPVRVVADGTVVFVRQPTAQVADPTLALNFRGGWSDDGCVIVKHTTEIGGDATEATSVTYFSIYMHLKTIPQEIVKDHVVFRMDQLGVAGSIYGLTNRIHFEIICDDANLTNLVGRSTPKLTITADGRAQVNFGSTYYVLPAGTEISSFDPRRPPPQVITQSIHTKGLQIVSVRYEAGSATIEVLQEDGTSLGTRTAANAEYAITSGASKAFVNSPSAGVEVLRLGRVLSTEVLNPANAPNWCEIPLSTGTGFVDLDAAAVHKFSDADFPHWRDWVCVDGTPSIDSRCLDSRIRNLLDLNLDGNIPPAEAQQALAKPEIQKKLSHKICKFQTEWDDKSIDARWFWLRTDPSTNMSADDYAKFKAHVTALCFWTAAALGVDTRHWHFQPRAFIEQFRQCGWLATDELAQCIPRSLLFMSGTTFGAGAVASFATARARASTWRVPLNMTTRKYGIGATKQRLLHFFSQAFEESGFLHLVKELGGENKSYAPYFGRGLIQLTHKKAYQTYGIYRGFPVFPSNAPSPFDTDLGWDPNVLMARDNSVFNANNCADSAGYYWTNERMNALGQSGLRVSDAGITLNDGVQGSKLTNGNVSNPLINGLEVRLEDLTVIKYVLLDLIRPAGATPKESITFVWRDRATRAKDDPPFVATTHTIQVPLTPQRP